MAESLENRRAGREEELSKKLKLAVDRFESVFSKPLTVKVILEYLAHEEFRNRVKFLRDRIGELTDADVGFLRKLIAHSGAAPEVVPDMVDADQLSLDEIDGDEENSSFV